MEGDNRGRCQIKEEVPRRGVPVEVKRCQQRVPVEGGASRGGCQWREWVNLGRE